MVTKNRAQTTAKKQRAPLTTKQEEVLKANAFQPGQSGNPGGRRPSLITDAYVRALNRTKPNDKEGRKMIDVVAQRIVDAAAKGDVRAIAEITDRVQGKAIQAVEVGGRDGGPIPFADVSPAENKRRIAELLAKAKGKGEGAAEDGASGTD